MRVLILILTLCLVSCAENQKHNTKEAGIASSSGSKSPTVNDTHYAVSRQDDRNQRVFVVLDSPILADIGMLRKIVKDVDSQYGFNDDLNISFVSNEKYAGYKDELWKIKGVPYEEFYRNYLGEYNKKSKVVWIFPALAHKKKKYIID